MDHQLVDNLQLLLTKKDFAFDAMGDLQYRGRKPTTIESAWYVTLAKWDLLVERFQAGGQPDDGGANTCGLCMMFFEQPGLAICQGCPISAYTSMCCCHDTPYKLMYESQQRTQAELGFLLEVYEDWSETWSPKNE